MDETNPTIKPVETIETTLPVEITNLALGAADEKASLEAELKAKADAERAKAEAERKEAEEKARKEKNASDVEKFENLALLISNIKMPDVYSDESKKLAADVNLLLTKVVNHINFRLQSL